MDRPTPLFPTQPFGCTPSRTRRSDARATKPTLLPLEVQILESVDGARDVAQIADSVELAPREVLHVLLRLQMLGAVSLFDLDGGWDGP
jgi:hypothetical protein